MENPGFFFDNQLIDVQDFNGVGESEPNPYFYQVNTIDECMLIVFSNQSVLLFFPDSELPQITYMSEQKSSRFLVVSKKTFSLVLCAIDYGALNNDRILVVNVLYQRRRSLYLTLLLLLCVLSNQLL